jgi:hypothetical protein
MVCTIGPWVPGLTANKKPQERKDAIVLKVQTNETGLPDGIFSNQNHYLVNFGFMTI